jgi:plastocyanin
MRAARAIPVACLGLLFAAGCGSSHPSGTTSGAPSATTSATTSTGGAATGLKVSTTPKFAAPPASAPVQSGVVQVAYHNIAIAPDTLKVRVGSTIVWTNHDPVEHNVTSHSGPAHFASGNLEEGQSYRVTLTRPGVIHYLCTIHPTTMNGTIEVVR